MKKKDLVLLYLVSIIIFSLPILIQNNPGYMDSEFYYLAGKQIASGENTIPVIWNYLDNPTGFPNQIFTYWMPGAAVISAISMKIFEISFLGSRILLLILAAAIAPITYLIAFTITENRMTCLLAGLITLVPGYYLKFLTIPETILIYIIFGGLFFYYFVKIWKNIQSQKTRKIDYILLGLFTGILHLTRVDGILFLFFGLFLLVFGLFKSGKDKLLQSSVYIFLFIIFYLFIIGPWYLSNLRIYGSLFSPATSRAIWISTYDDTFIFPPSQLTLQYWLENGLTLRLSQILDGLKMNLGTFIGVQTQIIGLPLLILGIKRNWKKTIMRVGIIYLVLIFLIMTIIFPLAGARGGFLHSSSASQIIIWFLIADGFMGFLEWGIAKRNWNFQRSIKMFLPAYLIVLFIFTIFVFNRDVIGSNFSNKVWNSDYFRYNQIETIIKTTSKEKDEVIMINNPLGYYYSTERWSLVIPNSDYKNFQVAVETFDVRFLVLDNNLPDKFSKEHQIYIENYFDLIGKFDDGTEIYEKES